ncbi:acyltransferase [Streptomyces sp. NRRL F-4489]|uniref:acyltransferase family protein n=1 Tax=Streptomyces sp. NRRL F-4489 TaxID=1609095 RepID=UPI0007498423|nr:acyltransferase [Streptomyces sp. NRRL F-4489]KUL38186.1 acyltransferase [Streptomyces sp. NRRL F-4489]
MQSTAQPAPRSTARNDRPAPPDGARLAAIDGLRLVAALAVAAYHYVGTTTPRFWGAHDPRQFAPVLHGISRYGWLGVEFFFLISGFVICLSCWGRTPAQFVVSRASRLFPAYWCAVLMVVGLVLTARLGHFPAATPIDLRTVLGNLTMAPGPLGLRLIEGVAWTLWVEARFYLLMAVMLFLGIGYRRMIAFCGAWLTLALIARELDSPVLDEFVLSQYAGLFVTGIALYLMHRFGQNLVLWLLAGFAWCYHLTVLNDRVAAHAVPPAQGGALSWTVCAAVLTLFLAVLALAGIGPLSRLRWRRLVTAGALTYPFYLVHQSLGIPVAKGLLQKAPGLGVLPSMAVGFAFSLALAAAVHRLVERPLGRVLRRQLTRGMSPGRAGGDRTDRGGADLGLTGCERAAPGGAGLGRAGHTGRTGADGTLGAQRRPSSGPRAPLPPPTDPLPPRQG